MMRLSNWAAALAGILVLAPLAARADGANPLIGQWLEQLNKKTVIFDFTADRMSSTPADADGKPTGQTVTAPVKYRRDGKDIDILFQGYSQGNLVVVLDNDNAGSLTVPGNPPHPIVRLR